MGEELVQHVGIRGPLGERDLIALASDGSIRSEQTDQPPTHLARALECRMVDRILPLPLTTRRQPGSPCDCSHIRAADAFAPCDLAHWDVGPIAGDDSRRASPVEPVSARKACASCDVVDGLSINPLVVRDLPDQVAGPVAQDDASPSLALLCRNGHTGSRPQSWVLSPLKKSGASRRRGAGGARGRRDRHGRRRRRRGARTREAGCSACRGRP